MSYFTGTIAHSTTGIKIIPIGFQPAGMRITVGQKVGVNDITNHKSVGITDGMNQFFDSNYSDGSGHQTKSDSTKLVSHYERVNGSLNEVLAVTFNSFTATAVKYNVTIANANYNLLIEVWS